jgi:hypothetical protein
MMRPAQLEEWGQPDLRDLFALRLEENRADQAVPIPHSCSPFLRGNADIPLLRAGEADQVAFGIAEVTNNQASPGLAFGAHQALPSEALGPFERGFNIRNPDVKECMALIARTSADATGMPVPSLVVLRFTKP